MRKQLPPPTKTTDTQALLAKVKHIVSNDLDCLLSKTVRRAPLEPEEVRRLKTLTEILVASAAEERAQTAAPSVTNNNLVVTASTEELKLLLQAHRKP